jgi:hypothetical protein
MLTEDITKAFQNSSYLKPFTLSVAEFPHDLVIGGKPFVLFEASFSGNCNATS